ncbi:MAG: DUF2065 domain-containing protein [Pseudomonadota bacterium]
MAWVLLALGLVMVVEGLAYVLAPSLIERVLEVLRALPEAARRQFGALVLVSGLICIWLAFFIGI